MSSFRELQKEREEKASRLEASNEQHQGSVKRTDDEKMSCAFGHDRVEILFPDECFQCGSSDPYGGPFCPICEFCCGC